MAEIGSIVFLAFIVLVPLAMVLLLIFRGVSRLGVNSVWRRPDPAGVFRFVSESDSEFAELEDLLDRGPLAHMTGFQHQVTHARAGTVAGARIWVCFVKSVGKGVPGQKQTRARFITMVHGPQFGEELVLQRPAGGRLGIALVERLGGFQQPTEPGLAAYRTNAPGLVTERGLARHAPVLDRLLRPGDTLVLAGNIASHVRPAGNEFHRRAISRYLSEASDRATAMAALAGS